MEVVITGRRMRITPTLKKHIEERAQRAEKYLSDPSHITFLLKEEKYRQIAEAHLTVNGLILKAEEETDEMQASVDQVMMKLERQLKKYKERVSSHRVRATDGRSQTSLKKKRPGLAWAVSTRMPKGQKEGILGSKGDVGLGTSPRMNQKIVLVPVLTLQDALEQMQSKRQTFFFFRDRANYKSYFLHKKENGGLDLTELRDEEKSEKG